ncbi:MAG: hypothetical protein LBS32_02945, partial [Clostridiales Family XIII bacterium]|nr:hypothetical protein [Clostridiales Family XIII bacterium]
MSGGKEGKVFSRGPSRKALAFLLAICLAAGLSGPYLGSQPFSLAEGQDTTSESAIGAEEPVGGEALSGAGVGIGTDGESAPPQPGEPVPIETPEGGFSPLDTQPEAVSPLEISLADAEGYLTEQIVPSIVIFVHEDATAMDSGLAVGASLQYTASQLGEPIHDVTYVIRSTGGLLLLPPAGYPNAGYDPNSVGFEEVSDTELRITIRKIDNEETGIVAGFPFRVMFPNGTTSDGAIGAAAISEVIYGGSTIIGSVDGDTWDYGDSHRSYRAEMKARAGVSWKYGLSRSPAAGDITLTYGALTGEGNDVATGASLTGDKNFKFTLSLTDNNAGSTQGVMNAERIVAAVTLAGISGAALDTDSFVFSKSPAAIVKDDGTGILTAYWNLTPDEAKNFSCDIAVDKFRLPAGFDSASKAAIVCGTVVFGEKIGGSLALSAVTAIDGEDYPIAVAPPQTFLIKKNAAPAPNYDRPTDDGILTVFRKSFVPWTYDSGLVRSYMTNDPDYPLEKGNQLDFSLIWKNNTERKLTSLEISETSGSGFNASHLKIVGFDKGSVTSGALTTSGPSVTVKYSDDTIVYDAASIDTSKTASEIVFRYTNVAPGYEPATRPSIRFEALPGADSVLSKATLRGTLRNTAYIKYGFDHDSDGATEDKAITGSDWEDVTYLGPAKGQVARNKTAKNLTKNGGYRTGYAAGDNVSYTLNIVNQNLAEVPPFENLLIKDVMDDLLGEVSKVKVVVTSRNTSRMSTISPGGIAGVQSTAPGGGYAITYSEVDVLQFSEMTDEQFDAYVTTEAIATPNGFVLLLKGLFYPGDSIDVIYETALASGAEPTDQPRAVENRYYTAFGYDDED